MARVLYGAQARADIAAIHAYVAERKPGRRAAGRRRHPAHGRAAGRAPLLGRPDPQGFGRVLVVPRFGYLVFYRVAGETVEIRYILHPSRDR